MNGLLIIHDYHEQVGTVRDHIAALMATELVEFAKIDFSIAEYVDISRFSVIVIHYSVVLAFPNHISDRFRERLLHFGGLKILFIQDEYRWIDRTAAAIRDTGIDVVFSLCDPRIVRQVYHHPWLDRVRFEHTLTGYVNPGLCTRSVPGYSARPVDVSYRARKVPFWMGRHTFQKWEIAERFVQDVAGRGLTLDISIKEEDRVYGDAWIDMLCRSKAVLGTESGVSVCDFTSEIQRRSEAYLAEHPDATMRELETRFFPGEDGRIVMNVISPRCFEAAALRTLMIMYPGEYDGILEPDRHYVLLQPDHSNLTDVLGVLQTPSRAKAIIATAYREIAQPGTWSYQALTNHLSAVIGQELGAAAGSPGIRHPQSARGEAGRIVEAAQRVAAHAAEAALAAEREAARAAQEAADRAKYEVRQAWWQSTIKVPAQRLCYGVAGVVVFVCDNWLPQRVRNAVRPMAQSTFRGIRSAFTLFSQRRG